MNLSVDIGRVRIRNPVITASGTFGYGQEYAELCDLSALGAIVTKGITLLPGEGAPPPRGVETAAGMLNAIGLQNVGVEAFVRDKMPWLREQAVPTVVNVQGSTIEEFAEVAHRLDGVDGIIALELNVSCPNKAGGLDFGTHPAALQKCVAAVRKVTRRPLITKLSPNVTDIVKLARAAVAGGTDSICAINTIIGMAIDLERRRPILGNITGGLSGPAIKPVALRLVWQIAQAVQVPVIGIGGIGSARDALEFLVVGASAVQIGTANFYNPRAAQEIAEGIERYLREHNISDVNDLIGTLNLPQAQGPAR